MTRDIPPDWPGRAASRMHRQGATNWHLQRLGSGRRVLALHGAGGSTHSWAGVAALLADGYEVLSLDLPGQGFSRSARRDRFGLATLGEDVAGLLDDLDFAPEVILGHSAGAVLGVHLASRLAQTPRAVVSLNGAFSPFAGLAGLLFPAMARALHSAPFAAQALSRGIGSERQVRAILEATGSAVTDRMLRCYLTLVRRPDHVAGTLGMMAQWDLAELDLSRAGACAHLLITGERDSTVPPETSDRFARRAGAGTRLRLAGVGHLALEEDPAAVAAAIRDWLERDA